MTPSPRRARPLVLAAAAGAAGALVIAVAPAQAGPAAAPAPVRATASTAAAADARIAPAVAPSASKPLAGLVIAVDPGHQLGNSNPKFRKQLSQKRFNGTIVKGCNTTGTESVLGQPEPTFTWKVAVLLKNRLEGLGATVPMTRTSNSWNAWGPCVWDRGMFPAKVKARLMVQIHADGAPSSGHGFFLITPALTRGWTDKLWRGKPIYQADMALAKAMKRGMIAAGLAPSTYIDNAILVMNDQTAMNFARVPTVTIESGNMRNAGDAARMASKAGQLVYARALLKGIRTYLGR